MNGENPFSFSHVSWNVLNGRKEGHCKGGRYSIVAKFYNFKT